MAKNTLLFFIFTLSLHNISFAESNYEWKDECDKSQSSMNMCAAEEFKHYDKILNNLYKEQINHLHTSKFKSYLKEAQLSWIKFRDNDCTYNAGKPEDSGSIWSLEHNRCLTERTKTRINELQSYILCRQNGCPW